MFVIIYQAHCSVTVEICSRGLYHKIILGRLLILDIFNIFIKYYKTLKYVNNQQKLMKSAFQSVDRSYKPPHVC